MRTICIAREAGACSTLGTERIEWRHGPFCSGGCDCGACVCSAGAGEGVSPAGPGNGVAAVGAGDGVPEAGADEGVTAVGAGEACAASMASVARKNAIAVMLKTSQR